MALSIFDNKEHIPIESDVTGKFGSTWPIWNEITQYVKTTLLAFKEEWSFPGKKYGWSCRVISKKRWIIYLIPCDGYFKVTFVLAKKATELVLTEDILPDVIEIIQNARVYAEVRRFRFDVHS